MAVFFAISSKAKFSYLTYISYPAIVAFFFILNRQNEDFLAYVDIFENPTGYAEPGYQFLVDVVKWFGGTHETILIVLGGLVWFTFLRFGKYSKFVGFAVLCYFIFPMTPDVVQIRNTFALFFFLNALIELANKRFLLSVAWGGVAVSFHYFSVVYLLIVVCLRYWENKTFRRLVLLGGLSGFLIIPMILPLVVNLEVARTLVNYYSGNIKIHSMLFWGVGMFLDVFLFTRFARKVNPVNHETIEIVSVLRLALVMFAVFSSGLLYLDEFNRLARAAFVVKYILAAILIPLLNRKDRSVLIFYCLLNAMFFSAYYLTQLNFDYILFGKV